ncbi:uncharacterized protein DDB_G0284459 isoform X1 [Patella vulgata]|uniref:uncharacterized protein DDB_G0284459 isoform X1 n=1 Tax=Patella vulgata TaxID=6465 RepID=UPI00217FE4B5|nr:uncharacterized protein DDB_G0284459 isoform X1 [Patella vulgata]XP_050393247.1 uncharacterized protein DDB_G0284459 isoform X1 [Patella vulgata]XP_050393249.1 uncharacterized protein DDB_G0284459 isoform X1 [Patella vulgata]
MSKNSRKPRQLSEQEVYRDAAKILDEVLADRLGRKIKSNGSSKSNVDSSSGYYDASKESLDIWFKDDNSNTFNIERSQTMPSSFKLEEKDEFIEQDIIDYMKTKSDFANRRHSGSATSGESDVLDNRIGSPLRRKKSFMKRAKERLSISFRRQDRDPEIEDILEEPEKKQRRKKKKNKNKGKENQDINDNKKVSKNDVQDDEDLSGVELRHRNRNRSDSTASKRSSIFDSIRKSFRIKRRPSTTIIESRSADAVLDGGDRNKDRNTRQRASINVPDRLPTIPAIPNHAIIDLDDIKYIDDEADKAKKPTVDNGSSGIKKEREEPELPKPKGNRGKPAPPPPKAPPLHHDTKPLGDNTPAKPTPPKSPTLNHGTEPLGDGHTGTPVLPDPNEIDGDDTEDEVDSPTKQTVETPFEMKSEEEKDDMFEKIARRLVDMADERDKNTRSSGTESSYSGSVQVIHTRDHSSSVDPDKLTSLEQDILDCLRVGGDRLSESFDDPVQKVIEAHRNQAYTRFKDTLRKGLGDEISWHQLSMIYHTATGAIKAAGATTQLAFRVKDMTQQYVGDKFASWIVTEGGWDSMLSESETEPPSN